MNIDLNLINNFYLSNRDKIFINDNNNYNIDENKYDLWVTNLKTTDNYVKENIDQTWDNYYQKFSIILKNTFRYISFNELYDRLKDMCDEIFNEFNNYDQIVFVIDGNYNKSNTWIFLLCYNYLFVSYQELYNNTKNKFIFINIIKKNNNDYDDNSLILHFDDMSYSGTQLYNGLYKDNYEYTNYYIFIPYITNSAYNLISEKHIKFLENTQIIPNIIDDISNFKCDNYNLYFNNDTEIININQTDIDFFINDLNQTNENSILYKHFFIYNRTTNVIFQHKIADNMSIPHYLYLTSPIPYYQNSKRKPCSLLNNCNCNEEYNINDIIMCNDYGDSDCPIDINVCPITFYKTINYTYDDNNINDILNNVRKFNELKFWDDINLLHILNYINNIQNEQKQQMITNKYYLKYIKYKKKYLNLKNIRL